MLNNKMKEIRQEKGLTLKYIAYKTDISVGYLCHLEKGTRNNPSRAVMEKIAEVLGSSVAEIFFQR